MGNSRLGLYSICGIFISLLILSLLFIKQGLIVGLAASLLPLSLVLMFFSINSPRNFYFISVCIGYVLLGLNRYMPYSEFPIGTLLDMLLVVNILIIFLHISFLKDKSSYNFKNSFNGYTIISLIWLVYIAFQFLNPRGLSSAWFVTFRGIALYMFLISVIVPAVVKNTKDITIFLKIWSILTVLGAGKAIMQKFIGFDAFESLWLFQGGGKVTHIIGYGVRYFSFFTDAANFGAQMAMSLTVFSILIFYTKSNALKFWYAIVSLLALYGMLLSGTRVAIAIPFVGFLAMIILSGRIKIALLCLVMLIGAFIFLKYTHIGEGNAIVRRVRSALNVNDPSMVVRKQNQALLKTFMVDKPFGVGVGLAGVKASKFLPGAYQTTIPTDSWFVMLWVETGIVGLILNILLLLYAIIYSAYQILFRIRDNLLKGINIALLGGVAGVIVASYANEILGQIPNCIFVYTSMALFFVIPRIDKMLLDEKAGQHTL